MDPMKTRWITNEIPKDNAMVRDSIPVPIEYAGAYGLFFVNFYFYSAGCVSFR
jgi:hypothetical protein